jgi:putative acetyltransferase
VQRNGWEAPLSPLSASALLPQVAPLRDASRRLVRELGFLDHRVKKAGVTHSQCHALIEIERRGVMAAGELAAVLNLDKSTTSRTVASLVRAGLVAPRAEGGDRRRRPLALTGKGRRKLAALHQLANRQVEQALELLGEADRQAVVRGMDVYAKALGRRRAQQEFAIRPIARRDDPVIAGIVRAALTEFGGTGPGYAVHDDEVSAMSQAYAGEGHGYWVVARGKQVVGGGGFGPLAGGEPGMCELRKMYFAPAARGLGMGARLLAHVLERAVEAGYRSCYLETLQCMAQARRLYESFGFRPLSGALGATGHFACDAFYQRDLIPGSKATENLQLPDNREAPSLSD